MSDPCELCGADVNDLIAEIERLREYWFRDVDPKETDYAEEYFLSLIAAAD
jgi:hypothetical protein